MNRPIDRPVRWLWRLGLATKGLVYLLMGGLALLAALGQRGGQIGDKRRSMSTLQALPGGRLLLGAIAIGLLAYVLLRILQGLLDTERRGDDARGLVRRLGYVLNGLLYVGLVTYAAHGAWRGRGEGDAVLRERSLIDHLLRWPGGAWLILGGGAIILGAGLYTMQQAYSLRFLRTIDLDALGEKRRAFVRRSGQIGYGARGLVMAIIGGFFLHAGYTAHAADIGNAANALDLLATMGPVVLGSVSFGLASYGVFAILQSFYPARR